MPFIDPARLAITLPDLGGRPRAEVADNRCVLELRVFRCFPFSSPEEYISIQDAGGHEVGILRNLEGLDAASKALLLEELDRRYFTPMILRIVTLKHEASMWRWVVETQRGSASFFIRGVRDSIHEVAARRWQITSMDGQRFEIRDAAKLDQRSLALFEELF